MIEIPTFHDGSFDGLWISDQKRVHLFLRDVRRQGFTLVLHGVKAMRVSNVLQGNIIFELVISSAHQLTASHFEDLYELSDINRETQIAKLLSSARADELSMLQMSASYGAEGAVLFSSADLHPGHFLG